MIDSDGIGFIHIPKAGGSSFTSALRSCAGQDVRIASIFDFANFTDELSPVPILAGHIPYFVYKAANPHRRLFTVLRSPVDRVLSNYRYILAEKNHYARTCIVSRGLSLAQCFDHPILRIEFTNFQTRMLGWSPARPLEFPAHNSQCLSRFFSAYSDFSYQDSGPAMLAAATNRLAGEVDFALLEDPGSLRALCLRMTGTTPGQWPMDNVTPATAYEPTAADIAAIHQHNRLDCALYDFARQRVESSDAPPRSQPRSSRHPAALLQRLKSLAHASR